MASTSNSENTSLPKTVADEVSRLLWGNDIKYDVFRRWTQGFEFSEDEPTSLLQHEGGPCAVIAPLQGFLLKNVLFSSQPRKDNWREISDAERADLLTWVFEDVITYVASSETFTIVYHQQQDEDESTLSSNETTEDGESSPKKRKFGPEEFHDGLMCCECRNRQELHNHLSSNIQSYQHRYGILSLLYSVILTKGIEQVKNEVEDPSEPLIDGMHGHGSQSLINMLLTGTAVTNVWDNSKDVSGLQLQGIRQKAIIGFLTLLEHMRYCEVGWFMKNPEYPIWILGSETHLTVLYSLDRSLVNHESPQANARRIFNQYDMEDCGFVNSGVIGDILEALDLVSDPEYVQIMVDKMDPEQLGIVTLQSFMETFFPLPAGLDVVQSFNLYHYNGLARSCPNQKVMYQECTAVVLDQPEVQIITDTSAIKTCIMTKWPTIELQWKNNVIPSLN